MKNKILGILLSVAVAFGLWLYVITVVSPESEKTYYEIPVVLQNKNILTERGLMIVSDDPKVTLALKSDRTILNDLNESNINVIINLANIEKPGTHSLTYDISYPGNIPDNAISVQSSSTDLIVLKVENRIRKTIPVVIDYGDTTVPEGYMADKTNAQYATSIEIIGPESVMEQITQAVIKVNLKDRTKSFYEEEFQYTLCDAEGKPVDAEKVTTNTENIKLSLDIERVKEIALNLEVIYGGGATTETATVTVDPTTIQISGSDTLLENLNSLTIGTVDLREILEDTTLTFPIALPDGVTNRTGVEQVSVDIKFAEMILKEFKVTTITPVNVPAGLNVQVITKSLKVTVRGPAELVNAMKETDLSATVDFSQTQAGTATVNAEIVIGSAFPGVGAVGTYLVSATVK